MENKNNLKIMLKISLLIVIVITLIGVLIYFLSDNKGDTTKLLYNESFSSVSNIVINDDSKDITVKYSDDNSIHVQIYGFTKEKADVSLVNNELNVSTKGTSFCIGLCYGDNSITLEVPKNYEGKFDIKTSSSNVEMNSFEFSSLIVKGNSSDLRLGRFNEVNLQTSSGNIDLEYAKELNIKANSGDIYVGEVNSGTINTTSGNVDIDKMNLVNNFDITTTSGDVDVKNSNDIYIENETNSGDVDVKKSNRYSDYELFVTTSSGNITVK